VARVEFEVLGPLRLRVDGDAASLSPMGRVLLGVLLARRNEPVTVDALTDALWEGRRTENAKQKLQLHVHQLRSTLRDPGRVTHESGTYKLTVHPGELDAERFESLLNEGREAAAAGDPQRCTRQLRKAMALWHGDPYAGCGDSMPVGQEAERLSGLLVSAWGELHEAELACGRQIEVVPELTDVVAAHPLDERLRALLMTALYRAGRTADALRVYREGREALVDELGLEPGPELRRVEGAILAGEEIELDGGSEQPPGLVMRPAQLPPDLSSFTGRSGELDTLVEVGRRGSEGTVTIAALDGMAGVGKTALAVRVAHRLAGGFPDGQVFLDLQGFTESARPVEPGEALDRLLRSLGVPGEQIPSDTIDRSGLWRSLLSERSMLVVLDNAASEAQVRPLLPASPGCLVLVTSRRRLSALDDAWLVSLDVLSSDEAVDLFRGTVGLDRLADQPAARVEEVVDLCGRLPLAVRLAAARMRDRPSWRLDDVLRRLREQAEPLAELEAGDRSVAAAFQLSYRQLDESGRAAFRCLGLHAGPDIDVHAAASLGDIPVRTARRLMDGLVDVHLLEQRAPDRYHFHDLLGSYAAQLADEEEEPAARQAAIERLLDHYTTRAVAAIDVLAPGEAATGWRPSTGDPVRFASPEEASAWLTAEQSNVVASAGLAARNGLPAHLIALSDSLHGRLHDWRRFDDALTLHGHALEAARQLDDGSAEGRTLRWLAGTRSDMGDYRAAADLCEQSLLRLRIAGDRLEEYQTLRLSASIKLALGEVASGREQLEQARALDLDNLPANALARMLNLLCFFSRYLGEYDAALQYSQESLCVSSDLGPQFRAETWANFGATLQVLGRHSDAIDALNNAIRYYEEDGNRAGQSLRTNNIGASLRQLGRVDEALDLQREALTIAREIGNRNVQLEAHRELGVTLRESGSRDEATHHLERSLVLAKELDQRFDQAYAHEELARTHLARGDISQARDHWQRALDIMTDLGIADAERVRDHLAALDEASAG
jgi:DNA-binding SARP family transcriptional activator/tetratricopeptide (TPR) repeat protein